jgi:chloramphenicol 3-O-phosphotransferase
MASDCATPSAGRARQNEATVNARISILNGVGSVGKSSTAKALQAITSVPFLRVSMYSFFDMLPERMIGHPEEVVFETTEHDSKPWVAIKTGPVWNERCVECAMQSPPWRAKATT